MTTQGQVILKPREESRILKGHKWVFSNEVSRMEGDPAQGSIVRVSRSDGRFLGQGFFNRNSLIAVRMLSGRGEQLGESFLEDKIRKAFELRQRLYPGQDSFRVVHGESDGLPGLIVDKYGTVASVQTLCLGLDLMKDAVCDALQNVLGSESIIERNESRLREREGLPLVKGVLRGQPPDKVEVIEGDVRFLMDPLGGQKTGFYFDQRENRFLMRRFSRGASVLDVYCHQGGFALHAAMEGASEVSGFDISVESVAAATENAELNGVQDICTFEVQDAASCLDSLHDKGKRFDVVILDPPSFTRSRKNVSTARKGYTEINRRGIRVLNPGGILATASCSFHITEETFLGCVNEAAFRNGRAIRQLAWTGQAPDHPVLPSMPETRYLKFGIFQVD